MPSDRLRVLLVEDHAVVREGTRRILEQDAAIEVIGEVEDGESAVESALRLRPDIVLLDVALPKLNGIEATRRIRLEDSPPFVLLLSAYDDQDYVVSAIEAGASGYLLKTASSEDLLAALRAVARGEVVLHPDAAQRLIGRGRDNGPALSDRELEVVRLAASGLATREIAQKMALSARTVEAHFTSVFNKLGTVNRAEAIATAASRGWLREPPGLGG